MDQILEKDKGVYENPEGQLNPQFDYRFIEGLKKNRPDVYDNPLEMDDIVLDKLISEGEIPRVTDEYSKKSAVETYPNDFDEPLTHSSTEERLTYIKEHWDDCIVKTSVDSKGDVNMQVFCNKPIESIDISVNLKEEYGKD